jgi:hypothetical protein
MQMKFVSQREQSVPPSERQVCVKLSRRANIYLSSPKQMTVGIPHWIIAAVDRTSKNK